jgi:type IV pilus assembly protein PilF
MKKILLIIMMLSGCTNQGGGSAGTPVDVTTHAQSLAKAHTELAASYYERGQYGIALQEVDVALRAKSNYAPAYNVRGLIRMALREDKQASEDFIQSLQLDSTDSGTHNNYGWFLCQRNRETEAIVQFLEAVKNPLYSTPETALVNAGLCSFKIKQLDSAEEYLLRALARQPQLAEALIGLAQVSFAKQDYAGAKSYILRFTKQKVPFSAEQLWLAIRIERKMGDYNAEDSYTLQLRKRFPDARETQLLQRGE